MDFVISWQEQYHTRSANSLVSKRSLVCEILFSLRATRIHISLPSCNILPIVSNSLSNVQILRIATSTALVAHHVSRRVSCQLSFLFRYVYKIHSWTINNLLDIIAVYFYSSFVFWLALRARQNSARIVKIYSRTTVSTVNEGTHSLPKPQESQTTGYYKDYDKIKHQWTRLSGV